MHNTVGICYACMHGGWQLTVFGSLHAKWSKQGANISGVTSDPACYVSAAGGVTLRMLSGLNAKLQVFRKLFHSS